MEIVVCNIQSSSRTHYSGEFRFYGYNIMLGVITCYYCVYTFTHAHARVARLIDNPIAND